MFRRKDFVTSVIIIYLILLVLFFANREQKVEKSEVCGFKNPCVRFCCFDSDSCNNQYIAAHFNNSLIPVYWNGKQKDPLFHFGAPICSQLEVLDSEWQFNSVRNQFELKKTQKISFEVWIINFKSFFCCNSNSLVKLYQKPDGTSSSIRTNIVWKAAIPPATVTSNGMFITAS